MSDEKTTSDGTYFLVYFVLAVLTLAQLGVSFSGLGAMRLPVSMGIASLQVLLVSLIFMHLKGSDTLTKITAVSALFFIGLLFMFTITDYLTRQWAAY